MIMNNIRIALIGMPGSGKSTLGHALSKRLSMQFYDLDKYIEQETGKKIIDLFEQSEETFRHIEAEMLFKVSQQKGIILSTGGGIIKMDKNRGLLSEKFIVINVSRNVNNIIKTLDIESRPILKNNVQNLYKLFNERHKIYRNCCDITIENIENDIEATIDDLIKEIEVYLNEHEAFANSCNQWTES